MDLSSLLDRALGLEVIFESADPIILARSEWMTSEPKTLFNVAFTKSESAFWNNLRQLAREIGDETLVDISLRASKALRGEIIPDKNELTEIVTVQKKARKEARDFAVERMATQHAVYNPQTKSVIQWPQNLGPDRLGWSKEDLDEYYQKIQARREKDDEKKKYFGDTVWGIYRDNELVSGKFPTEIEAQIALLGDPAKYPDPDVYKVIEYENSRSLRALKKVFLPTKREDDKWTTEEVINAMTPYIRKIAYKFRSDKVPVEDLMQQGALAVISALKTDAGLSPFPNHAFKHIYGEISRLARTAGVIKGATKGGAAGFREIGGLKGYRVMWLNHDGSWDHEFFPTRGIKGEAARRTDDPGYKEALKFIEKKRPEVKMIDGPKDVTGGTISTETPTRGKEEEGERPTIAQALKATKVRSPAFIASVRNELEMVMKKANLSHREEEAFRKAYGLDIPAYKMGGGWEREPEFGEEPTPGLVTAAPKPKPEAEKGTKAEYEFIPRPGGREPGEQAGLPAISLHGQRKVGPGGRPTEQTLFKWIKTPKEIAKEVGLSKQRVRDLLHTAILKIRRTSGGFAQALAGIDVDEPVEKERIAKKPSFAATAKPKKTKEEKEQEAELRKKAMELIKTGKLTPEFLKSLETKEANEEIIKIGEKVLMIEEFFRHTLIKLEIFHEDRFIA